jgi:hypothetical protein
MQIRKLAVLVAMGKRVYVHCTAGINRATLTVVGYLTFVEVRRVCRWRDAPDASLSVGSLHSMAHAIQDVPVVHPEVVLCLRCFCRISTK